MKIFLIVIRKFQQLNFINPFKIISVKAGKKIHIIGCSNRCNFKIIYTITFWFVFENHFFKDCQAISIRKYH